MEDGTGAQAPQSLWIDWAGHILSFHEEAGYQRLEFGSLAEKMAYVLQQSSSGFRIQ